MSRPQDREQTNDRIARGFENIARHVAEAESIAGLFEALIGGIDKGYLVEDDLLPVLFRYISYFNHNFLTRNNR